MISTVLQYTQQVSRRVAESVTLLDQCNSVSIQAVMYQVIRIPIWVGGGWPLKGPARRAGRWDGAGFYKHSSGGSSDEMMPEDVRAL